MLNRTLCTALLVSLGAFTSVARAQQDTFALKDGTPKKAKILSEEFDVLKYSLEGGTADLRWRQIQPESIRYAGAESYQKAVDAFTAGKLSDAVPQLEALAGDAKLRNVLRQGSLYTLGLAYQKQGQTDKAIATFEQLLTDFPRSRYLVTVATNLLGAYRDKGNGIGAAKSIEPALTAAKGGSSDPALEAELNVLRGMLLFEQKKWPDAERTFNSAANATGAAAWVVPAAKLGMARCAHENAQKSEAQKRYREIVAPDPTNAALAAASNTVLAGAWNGLGDLALEEATAARDRDGLRVALFAYLRGVVQYTPERDGLTEEHERAIAGAAKAFRSMGELESNADRKRQLLDRAKERLAYLAQKYPNSRFLKSK